MHNLLHVIESPKSFKAFFLIICFYVDAVVLQLHVTHTTNI